MKITFVLRESIYDCKIQISDSHGSRYIYLSASSGDDSIFRSGEERTASSLETEIFDADCLIDLIPVMPDISSVADSFEETNWKDRLAKKASVRLLKSLELFLRVGCRYRAVGLQDGDRLDIRLQSYAFGSFDRWDLFGLAPVSYAFFELFSFNDRYPLVDAYATNRKEVLRIFKLLELAELGNGFLWALFAYPLQVGRVKRLTKPKKVRKTLTRFANFSDSKRQRFLEKQEAFFDR